MRIVLSVAAVALALAGATACASRSPVRGVEAADVDRKLSRFAFMEEGDLVTFIVDVRPTLMHEKSEFVPFEIAVANRGLNSLTLTRESFVLIDEDGNRYHMAEPRDLLERHEFLDIDRNVAELEGIVFNRFAAFTRYRSTFSPTRLDDGDPFTTTTVKDRVSLPRFGYMIDFVYFPKPVSGAMNRRFEMHMEAPELSDPIFVKFVVY